MARVAVTSKGSAELSSGGETPTSNGCPYGGHNSKTRRPDRLSTKESDRQWLDLETLLALLAQPDDELEASVAHHLGPAEGARWRSTTSWSRRRASSHQHGHGGGAHVLFAAGRTGGKRSPPS